MCFSGKSDLDQVILIEKTRRNNNVLQFAKVGFLGKIVGNYQNFTNKGSGIVLIIRLVILTFVIKN